MNYKLVARMVGYVVIAECVMLILPTLVSLGSGRTDFPAFVITVIVTGIAGAALWLPARRGDKGDMYAREGLAIVTLSWVVISMLGALPFFLSGYIPNYLDALFECISGFTTSGLSILTDVETLPNGLLFWRSFTQFLGGMGVLVLFLAILPSMGGRAQYLLKAEAPGPNVNKLVPRLAGTAKYLYGIYVAMTLVEVVLLVVAGLPLFDAVVTSFATAGTGGYAIKNASLGAYENGAAEIIVSVFMLLFSINFAVYYGLLVRRFAQVKQNTELKVFGIFIAVAVGLVWMDISSLYGALEGFGHALFAVSASSSTSCFYTQDLGHWPDFARGLVIVLTVVGACGGSTGGGLKLSRVIILFKAIHREIKRVVRPRTVSIVRMDGKALDDAVTGTVMLHLAAYLFVTTCATLLLALDKPGLRASFAAVLSCLNNTGVEAVFGFSGLYAQYSAASKALMMLCMMLGRLEIFPVLVLMAPTTWRRK